MDIQFILNELYEAGVLESHMQNLKPLTGGTSSEVVVVMDGTRPRYVIKQNDPAIVKAEAEFLLTYAQIEKLSRVIYVVSCIVIWYMRSSQGSLGNIVKEIRVICCSVWRQRSLHTTNPFERNTSMVIRIIRLWNGEIFCSTERKNPKRLYKTSYP
ncbi:hypothetical protein [Paenibacillus polymyxa]|uniref:hypothetical protein n=1 Tax=Paenibacillus polymyxa TaxID=1406 RepID=UPI0025B6C05F|nr:hypothetical protein [Paenibacillus polymyxa]MDN4083876.1 hypothetical protein [Paenibacillus polymyxa]MDN4087484.1 hypothetical protein [Paenibacillus polymyxa]MDN4109104.1 hypothetical protein [Paenibacillus polymyxa]